VFAALGMGLALLFALQPGTDAGAARPPAAGTAEEQAVLARARGFFADLLARRISDVVEQSELPFYLEGRRISSRDGLAAEWARNLSDKRLDALTLYGIEIFTPLQMQKRYGTPPSRLSKLPWRRENTYLAVANISGRAAIAIFHRSASGWRAVGFTD
jgi:hypothetical protein